MGKHIHIVDLGQQCQSALLTLMNAAAEFQLAGSRGTPSGDLISRIAELLLLPVDLAEEVLRGSVNTSLDGTVLQLDFSAEQFKRLH